VILVCAATGTEAAACRRGIAEAGARDVEVLVTGVGPARAAAALGRRLAAGRPSLVVSSGFAGALSAGIEPLSWVTAAALHRLDGERAARVVLPPGLLRVAEGVTPCQLVTAERVVASAVAGLPPPVAVDMESSALAEASAAAGVPFAVLRLVTDAPGRPMAEVGRRLAAALAAPGLAGRAVQGARAAVEAARSPARAAAFLRDTSLWRERLRAGWCERAAREGSFGVLASGAARYQ
jgi:hypothetical protein